MAYLLLMKGKYENEDVVNNVIRYITRTRFNESRAEELVAYGGRGISLYQPIEIMIIQFCSIQDMYRIKTRKGRRIRHEVLTFSKQETDYLMRDPNMLIEIAERCSQIIFASGFQVVYAIHFGECECECEYENCFGYHIHFAINAINYINGIKIHLNFRDHKALQIQFQGIVRETIQSFRSTLIQPFVEI